MSNKLYLLYRCMNYDQVVLGIYTSQELAAAEGNRTISHWGLKRFNKQNWERQTEGAKVWLKQPKDRTPDDLYFLIVCRTLDEKVSL